MLLVEKTLVVILFLELFLSQSDDVDLFIAFFSRELPHAANWQQPQDGHQDGPILATVLTLKHTLQWYICPITAIISHHVKNLFHASQSAISLFPISQKTTMPLFGFFGHRDTGSNTTKEHQHNQLRSDIHAQVPHLRTLRIQEISNRTHWRDP